MKNGHPLLIFLPGDSFLLYLCMFVSNKFSLRKKLAKDCRRYTVYVVLHEDAPVISCRYTS